VECEPEQQGDQRAGRPGPRIAGHPQVAVTERVAGRRGARTSWPWVQPLAGRGERHRLQGPPRAVRASPPADLATPRQTLSSLRALHAPRQQQQHAGYGAPPDRAWVTPATGSRRRGNQQQPHGAGLTTCRGGLRGRKWVRPAWAQPPGYSSRSRTRPGAATVWERASRPAQMGRRRAKHSPPRPGTTVMIPATPHSQGGPLGASMTDAACARATPALETHVQECRHGARSVEPLWSNAATLSSALAGAVPPHRSFG
jgi:hypothetical protein